MDLGDAPFVMVMEADDGVRTATMRDGTVLRYRVPHFAEVILPSAEAAERFAGYVRAHEAARAKAERPFKAVAMRRENPAMSFKAIASAIGASPASVSKWIGEADGKPKRARKPPKSAPALTPEETATANDQAMAEFMQRGGDCTRAEIDARAAEIGREMLAAKRS